MGTGDPPAHRRHARGVLKRNAGFVGIAGIMAVLGVICTVGGLTNPGAGDALLAGRAAKAPDAVLFHEIPNSAVLLQLLRDRGVPFNPQRHRTMERGRTRAYSANANPDEPASARSNTSFAVERTAPWAPDQQSRFLSGSTFAPSGTRTRSCRWTAL